jgi:hypothetical protein
MRRRSTRKRLVGEPFDPFEFDQQQAGAIRHHAMDLSVATDFTTHRWLEWPAALAGSKTSSPSPERDDLHDLHDLHTPLLYRRVRCAIFAKMSNDFNKRCALCDLLLILSSIPA